ncbi:MAG: hypothetical protein DKM50_02650 [Candidatus Margulisiibacteriota bacterium]|nr:MAG: hypothetical protein A2X43_03575 [Candidatus Margulisbacteria bacterium GWD2_39_127]OGI02507.1 MAG: hypothetical protein A2X42_07470 [Candidatus Margulisbacteria bacterium GWF2_38_17]OGI11000.1 MAG: hypothetical protein A2X41_01995 [Candidatus Margulisbacteria bacterium GWE2_39_32]PZM83192.1 MAG: hypothetical protein DKM50_02650 [Candidatus Margulisiibacteriota bacterium]HAR62503.1 hypothetical protein [Candidatus Margulisiibacteriota bacterium]
MFLGIKSYISKVFYILGKKKSLLLLIFFVFLLSSILEFFSIAIILPYVAILQNPLAILKNEWARNILTGFSITSSQKIVIYSSLLLIAVYSIKSMFFFIVQCSISYFTYDVNRYLRERLYSSYVNAPYQFFLNQNAATLITNISDECYKFSINVVGVMATFMSEAIFLLIIICALVFYNVKLLLLVFVVVLFIYSFYRFSKNKTFEYGRIGSESHTDVFQIVNQTLNNIKIIKINNLQEYYINEVKTILKKMVTSSTNYYALLLLPRIIFEMLFITSIVVLIIYCQSQLGGVKIIIPMLSTMAIAAIRLMPSVTKISNSMSAMKHSTYTVERIYTILKKIEKQNQNQKLQCSKDQPNIQAFKDRIEIKNLVFEYEATKKPVINGLNLSIKKGSSIAFTGKSGSGKTTLVNILLGLLYPQSGDISIDGLSIYSNLANWQSNIGYVPQDIYLMNDSIRCNVALGINDEKIDTDMVNRALTLANLDALIAGLPDGINTRVGENGIMLSGGQKQRIGIARALYTNPSVIVFDEATSSLDSETENAIQKSIDNLAGEKTIIIVTHRLTTLKNCDVIYRIENGDIVQTGTYQDMFD